MGWGGIAGCHVILVMMVCVGMKAQMSEQRMFGGVVLEAMALELPVVATALGGSIEQVVEWVTGFLVPPADPEAIADRLEKLAQSPALRQQLGHAGRARIQQVLSLDRAVVGIEAAYTELLQSNPAQR